MQKIKHYWAVVLDKEFLDPNDGSWTSTEGQTLGLIEGMVEATSADEALGKFVLKCGEEEPSAGFRPVVAYSEADLRQMLKELTS